MPAPKLLSLRSRPAQATLFATSLMASFLPGSALAADASDERPDILVLGQRDVDANPNADPDAPYKVERSQDGKYTQPVRDTPKSMVIIPKEVIEDVGATSFREVARSTPGVTLGTGEGGNAFGDRIFIRGFEARNDIYIDGMRDPGVTSREIFALEQVEIVKGPNSAFGGRGTTGGAVGLQSKKAQDRDFVVAEAGVGTDNFTRATLDINRQLADGVNLRINALYHNADTPGRDYVDNERYGVAAALSWRLHDTVTIDADFYHFRSDGMSDYGHPFDPVTQEPYAVDADNFYGAVGRDFLKNRADIGTVTAHWEPSEDLQLQSQMRYGEVTTQYVVSVPRAPDTSDPDPANWTVSTGTPQRNASTRYWANITSATANFSTGSVGHVLVAGGEYSNERITNRSWAFPEFVEDDSGTIIGTPGGFTRNLFHPDPVLGYTIAATVDDDAVPAVTRVESWSLFALDTITLSRQFSVLLGGRYDSFAIRSTGQSRRDGLYDLTSHVDFFNWQASAIYKPVEALSLYASISTSSNPSGEQLDSASASYGGLLGVQQLKPERNKALEIGAKWEVADGNLLLTAALFRIDKDNAREQTAPGVYEQVGKLRSEGFELGVNGNITQSWALFGGYSYLDARIQSSPNASLQGARFANVPRHNVSLLSTYRISEALTLGGQAYYRSRIYGGDSAAGSASVPGYWRFDAVARYRISSAVEARANILNVTDKRYYDAIYRSGTPFSYVAPGRSGTVSLTVQF